MVEDDVVAAARKELRERQGPGARYDAATAPHGDLLLARRGTAYFARRLKEILDTELDEPSALTGLTRRHVVAQVAFQARRLARLVAASRLELPVETIVEPELHAEDIDLAVTLPSHALRNLFLHSGVHLNVEWGDLPAEGWERHVTALNGEVVSIKATPLMRAREIWTAAMTLDRNPRWSDVPAVLRSPPG